MTEKKTQLPIGTVEAILAADDVPEELVPVPEWNCSVLVRGFTKRAQQRWRKEAANEKGEIDTARLEMLMFVNGVAEPAFTEEHYEALLDKAAGAVDRVLKKVLELSGLSAGFPEAKEA